MRARLDAEIQPQGPVEEFLTEQVALGMQRLRRVERVETGVLVHRLLEIERSRALAALDSAQKTALSDDLSGMRVIVADERRHADARARLQEINAAETQDLPLLGRGFHADASGPGAVELAARYRSAIERSLLRMLRELREVQAARRHP